MSKYTKLFDDTLGVYPHKKFHIEITDDVVPTRSRPYAVPQVHLTTFKKELEHLVAIGVLSKAGTSKWGSPTFIIPKKTVESVGSVICAHLTSVSSGINTLYP